MIHGVHYGIDWLRTGQFGGAEPGSTTRQAQPLRQSSLRKSKAPLPANGRDWRPAWSMSARAIRWSSPAWIVSPAQRCIFARSPMHLQRKGVHLQVIDQHIDTSDATGRLLFNMLGAIAQFETEIRAERQMDGIHKAKSRGIQFGAKPKLTAEQIAELRQRRQQGDLIRVLMHDYNLSKATVYRYLSAISPLNTANYTFSGEYAENPM